MSRFVLVRLMESMIVLLIMSFVIYALVGLMPGDPIDLMIMSDPKLTPADAARLREAYGIDKPITERYLAWLMAVLQWDFGNSRLHARPVLDVMGPFLLNSVNLMVLGFALSLVIALPAGIYAALNPHSRTDHAINLLCFAGISIPVFWLALMLIIVFSVILGVLPASGVGTVGEDGFLDRAKHLVLPTVTLTVFSVGHYTRFVRASMMETLRQDFIRTARAKGAGEQGAEAERDDRHHRDERVAQRVAEHHPRPAGALITETMFAYPGMGKMIYDSIMGSDYNLALIGLLFATLLTLLANIGADIAYAWLDPRITYKKTGAAS